jgi:glycosyltransferase involved in cell wall biosynthesis
MENSQIKVSVIIPTYKRANLVCLTLDSLLEQDFPKENFEVLIIDNNSPDNTSEVIAAYFEKNKDKANMRYVKEVRQGDGYARNSGAAVARGEYLLFADDDSLFDTNWISCMADILDIYPNIGILGSRITIQWDEKPSKWISRYEYLLGKSTRSNSGYIISSEGFNIANGSLAIRRDLFVKVGGNNPGQIGEWLVGDGEVGLCQKVIKLGFPIAFTDDTTMWHMQTKTKNGTYQDIIRRLKNIAISDAYGDVVVKGIKQYRDINGSLNKIIRSVFKLKRSRIREAVFQYLSNKAYNEYVDKYQSEAFLSANLNLEDHKLGENYLAPKPGMSIDYIVQQ